jgi:alpha-mannosidase
VSGELGGVVLVPHTHWDREWYEPFQVFRLRLVDVFDDVVTRAEADGDFRFTIDGQMAAVDDYLEIRPECRARVSALVARGQLAVGPWHILLDEFLCSGETIVRNLELGWRGASALGGPMPVGYLPDMFGHCAQMPQILARAGIGHACLWRGVPAGVDRHAFRWVAPDGSAVRVEYLFDGYGNALHLFALPERLGTAVAAYCEATRYRFGDDALLGMLGTDHSAPRSDLMRLVRDHDGPAALTVATLAEYVSSYPPGGIGLPEVVGEMRSHARGNILPGVISVRVELKQAMAGAERMMAQAESVAAQWSADPYRGFVDLAWRRIVESSAHDSVTGCGVDETATQVAARLAEATQIGRAVRDRVVRSVAAGVPSGAHLAVNTLTWARTALVELDVATPDGSAAVLAELADGTPLPIQEISRAATLLADEEIEAADLERVLRRIHGRELFGQQIEDYEVGAGRLDLNVTHAPKTPGFDLPALRAALAEYAATSPGTWRVRTRASGRRRVVVAVPVPASGHVAVRTAQGTAVPPVELPVVADGFALDNGDVEVDVAADGTLTVRGADGTTLSGVGRFVDGGDRGDSYNYAPPARDVLVDTPSAVRVRMVETGPLRGIVEIARRYDWPGGLSDDMDKRGERTVRVVVTTLAELRVGEPFVRVEVTFTNPGDRPPGTAARAVAIGRDGVGRRGPVRGDRAWPGGRGRRLGRVPAADLSRLGVRLGGRRDRAARPRHRVRTGRGGQRTRTDAVARRRVAERQCSSAAGRAGRSPGRRARRPAPRREGVRSFRDLAVGGRLGRR